MNTKMREQYDIVLKEVFLKAAGSFAESIHMPDPPVETGPNAFGREVLFSETGGLSRLVGTAASGLRSAAWLDARELEKEAMALSTFSRLHIPLTLVVASGHHKLHTLINAGCIVLSAGDARELYDLILVAQVISERALTPVAVLAGFSSAVDFQELPGESVIRWLGDPDARATNPTKAQGMVFGSMRRRMPLWFHMDQNILAGARKDREMTALENASFHAFSKRSFDAIIRETLEAFKQISASSGVAPFTLTGPKKYRKLIICAAADPSVRHSQALERTLSRDGTGVVVLQQLNPLPGGLSGLKQDLKKVTLLEPFADNRQAGILTGQLARPEYFENVRKTTGYFIAPPGERSIEVILEYTNNESLNKNEFWLDIKYTIDQSLFPKHEILVQQIRKNYPELEQVQVRDPDIPLKTAPVEGHIPSLVRRKSDQGPPFSRISRFYDDTFCLYDHAREELIADPFQSYPVMPAATARFYDRTGKREKLPVFHPELCTDIDELLASCPFGALPSGLITIEKMVETGIKLSAAKGNPARHIMPVRKQWVQAITQAAVDLQGKVHRLKDLMLAGFRELPVKEEQEKADALRSEVENIISEIGQVPVVIDQVLFIEQERREKGTGELFILAVDPYTCTACGFCASIPDKSCMEMARQSDNLDQVISEFNEFDQMPVTPDYSILRLLERKDFDPLTALMMNKDRYQSFTASANNNISHDETVIRYVLAMTDYTTGASRAGEIEVVESLIAGINARITDILSGSLPVKELNTLTRVLEDHDETRLDMNEILHEWGSKADFGSLEKEELHRKLSLLEELKHLEFLLKNGNSGDGRASCTVVLDKSLGQMAEYPFNSFTIPVLHTETSETAAVALGACKGQIRHALDQVRLMRRAELESKNQYVPSKHDEELAGLSWEQLTPDEKNTVRPVIILANHNWLSVSNSIQVMDLIQQDLPVKICLVDQGSRSTTDLHADLHAGMADLWPIIARGNTYVGAATLQDRRHLYHVIKRCVDFKGPGMIKILAPEAAAFDIDPQNWQELSALAVSSRAFLPFSFDPEWPDDSVSSQIRTGVQSLTEDFVMASLAFKQDGKDRTLDYPLTWADWAFLQHRFKPYFKRVEQDDRLVFMHNYLNADEAKRKDKIPVIVRVNKDKEAVYYQVAPIVAEACRIVVRHVRLLREWSGLYTQYPEKLRKLVRDELEAEFEAHKTEFERDLMARQASWEANYLQELKKRMKDKLLDMSGM